MRKVALILILSLVFATPVLAAHEQATPEQSQAWDKMVLGMYQDKYGESEDYADDYVDISDWTIIDVDSSTLENELEEEIAEKERELNEARQKVSDLQEQFDYFKSLGDGIEDEDYKEQIEPTIKDTEKSLDDANKEVESLEKEIEDLEDQEFLNQIAVAQVAIKFGGKVLGTMTHREDQFVNPETGELVDNVTAKQYDEVNEFLDQLPQVEQQTVHHDSVGLLFLVLALAGWLFVSRKF